ncbi:MAG: hypothetical protein IKO10_03900 [Lachnospiraceae bacterium]|nr:hypothetical protein [Lachnospiraceae bacterium]
MGKKKEKKGGFKQDTSIVDRRKQYRETVIGEAVIIAICAFYGVGSIIAYAVYYGDGADIKATFEQVKEYPLFMFNVMANKPETIGTILGGSLFAIFMAELFVLLSYYVNRARIHSDLDTLKGSTVWQSAKEVSERYADIAEDEPKPKKKTLFERILEALKGKPKPKKEKKAPEPEKTSVEADESDKETEEDNNATA